MCACFPQTGQVRKTHKRLRNESQVPINIDHGEVALGKLSFFREI